MALNDYRCYECGFVKEDVDADRAEIRFECDNDECDGLIHYRLWKAPHLGSMSSGEPPR